MHNKSQEASNFKHTGRRHRHQGARQLAVRPYVPHTLLQAFCLHQLPRIGVQNIANITQATSCGMVPRGSDKMMMPCRLDTAKTCPALLYASGDSSDSGVKQTVPRDWKKTPSSSVTPASETSGRSCRSMAVVQPATHHKHARSIMCAFSNCTCAVDRIVANHKLAAAAGCANFLHNWSASPCSRTF
jgi:hypothetical protein